MRSGQKWVRLAILAVGTIVLLAFIAVRPLLSSLTKRDRLNAVPRQGVATVAQILPPTVDEYNKPAPAQVWVRFDGRILPASEAFGAAEMKVGDQSEIVYRVGKSGRVYVDRVEALNK